MHPNNIHHKPYNFIALCEATPALTPYVFVNSYGNKTINFSNPDAVYQLNKAILHYYYQIPNWEIPKGYLCPPIPGRADYIHHLSDLLEVHPKTVVRGLDIGVGANCIYPILGSQLYGWDMVGVDRHDTAVISAIKNVNNNPDLKGKITILKQDNPAHLFKGAIQLEDYFHFTMCNPPFHGSENEATKGTLRKLDNLGQSNAELLNFGGQANELWCNGGEALFIKRMIKESVFFKEQVGWFTSLVSKKEHLKNIYKQLDKAGATHKTIPMEQGHKKSRIIVWRF